jgi:hypothetical protein
MHLDAIIIYSEMYMKTGIFFLTSPGIYSQYNKLAHSQICVTFWETSRLAKYCV